MANKNYVFSNMKKIIFLFSFLFISSLMAQIEDKTGLNDLLKTGTITVTIGGDFIVTGSFPALITERVDQFITRTYNEATERILRTTTDPVLLEKLREQVEDFSLRDITLKRSSGEILKLDLQGLLTSR